MTNRFVLLLKSRGGKKQLMFSWRGSGVGKCLRPPVDLLPGRICFIFLRPWARRNTLERKKNKTLSPKSRRHGGFWGTMSLFFLLIILTLPCCRWLSPPGRARAQEKQPWHDVDVGTKGGGAFVPTWRWSGGQRCACGGRVMVGRRMEASKRRKRKKTQSNGDTPLDWGDESQNTKRRSCEQSARPNHSQQTALWSDSAYWLIDATLCCSNKNYVKANAALIDFCFIFFIYLVLQSAPRRRKKISYWGKSCDWLKCLNRKRQKGLILHTTIELHGSSSDDGDTMDSGVARV